MKIIYNPIKTFTCRYDPKEDRLILTFNYQDIQSRMDFWITRSFLLKLLPVFFDYNTSTTLFETKDETQLQNTTDTSLYIPTYQSPILLESVDFQTLDHAIRVVFKNFEKGIYYEAVLERCIMEHFIKLVLSSVPKYDWGIYNI